MTKVKVKRLKGSDVVNVKVKAETYGRYSNGGNEEFEYFGTYEEVLQEIYSTHSYGDPDDRYEGSAKELLKEICSSNGDGCDYISSMKVTRKEDKAEFKVM